MAEVLAYWPQRKSFTTHEYYYPWEQWAALDENGHGDIWLAVQGVDYPADMPPYNFRSILWSRVKSERKKRLANQKFELRRVRLKSTGEETVRRVSNYRRFHLKIVIVSAESVAFQFYDSPEPPPMPTAQENTALRKRKPMFEYKNRRVLERRQRSTS